MSRLSHVLPKTRTRSPSLRFLSSGPARLNSNPKQDPEQPCTADSKASTRAQDAGPGWSGRDGRDHAVKRPPYDVQAEAAQQGLKDHKEGKEGSDAISRKDERKNQSKAKDEFPEAPVVIGMNDERGSKEAF